MTASATRRQETREHPFRWRIAIAAVLAALVAVPVWLWFAFIAPTLDPYANVQFAPYEVTLAPRLHMLGRLAPSTAYVVETSDGLVLIDTGIEADAASLIAQMKRLGLDVRDVRAILLSHAHGDHVLGARRVAELSGAKIHIGEGDADVVERGGPRTALFSTFSMDHVPIHATNVDVRLKGGEKIKVGDTTIEAIAAPGHTPGSTCYLMERDGRRHLFGGDVISSLVGDLGIYSAYLAPRYRGNAGDYLQTLRMFREMPPPDLVLPGHPNVGEPHNLRVTPDQWRTLLDENIRKLEVLTARYDADGEDFLDEEAKELLPDLFYLGDYHRRGVYYLRTAGGRYLFDAPGGEGLVKFLEERFEMFDFKDERPTAVVLTSCDPAAISGLGALVRETKCKVIVPVGGELIVRDACPSGTDIVIATSDDVLKDLPARFLRLDGRGIAPAAWSIEWKGKRVLVSGQIPIYTSEASVTSLIEDLQRPDGNQVQYLKSVSQLKDAAPNLWLPAVPIDGQNANVYGEEWSEILSENRMTLLGESGR